jgi:hypothetical protein
LIAAAAIYSTMLRPSPYLSPKLTRPFRTKDGGTLRAVLDARTYTLGLSKNREQRVVWYEREQPRSPPKKPQIGFGNAADICTTLCYQLIAASNVRRHARPHWKLRRRRGHCMSGFGTIKAAFPANSNSGLTYSTSARNYIRLDCTTAACRGEYNQNEVFVVGYCGARRTPVTLINERTATCPRLAATSPLIMACAKAAS